VARPKGKTKVQVREVLPVSSNKKKYRGKEKIEESSKKENSLEESESELAYWKSRQLKEIHVEEDINRWEDERPSRWGQ